MDRYFRSLAKDDEENQRVKAQPRVAAVQACRYVTEVVPAAPTIINEAFMATHAIDMVFHGHVEAEDHLY